MDDALDRPRDPREEPEPILAGGDAPGGAGPGPELPERIGRYRVLGKLGEGGMGLVLEAEQESPRRRVALKVVRGGELLDDVQVRLFQREADTLARLEHPNIAAIYEAGRTPGGRHFFAMELVRGRTLDRWLAERPERLDSAEIERRLALFRAICDAVQYAHQRGVVHRDLKPGNLVVVDAERAGSGATAAGDVVKVLDFGLARILDAEGGAARAEGEGGLAGASLRTEVGMIKGTLAYMSPEQARGDPAGIDTRADVYALGVLLYELLTGSLPLDVSSVSVIEALRVVCEDPPAPIERRWKGTGRVDSDLATIVRKALAKDPEERYSSAAALSEDVGRWLAREPILARPPSALYQLKKLIARRKAPFAAAAGGVVLVLAFGVGMSVLYARSERNLRRALAAEQRAEEGFGFAREAVDRYFTQVSESPELAAHGLETLRRELLGTARAFYEDLAARRADEGLRAELGAAHIRLANIDRILGEHDEAARVAREGIAIFDALVAEEPDNLHYQRELAVLQGNLALVHSDTGRDEEALEAFRAALALDELLAGRPGASDDDRSRLGNTIDNRAQLLERLGRLEEAEAGYEQAVAVREALHEDAPGDAAYLRGLVQSLNNRGIFYARQGRLEEAEPPLARAIELAGELAALDPGSASDNVVAATLGNLAGVRVLDGRLDEARADYERELALRRELARRHPSLLDYRLSLGTVLCNLGELETRAGHPERSLPWFEEAIETFERVLATEPRHATARHSLSYTYSWRARAFEALDDWPAALADWERAITYDDRDDPALRGARDRAAAR